MDGEWAEILLKIGAGASGGVLTVGFIRHLMNDSSNELLFCELKYGRKLRIFAAVLMLFALGLTVAGHEMWMVSGVGAAFLC